MEDRENLVIVNRNKKDLKPVEYRFMEAWLRNGGKGSQAAAEVKGFDLNDPKEANKARVWACKMLKKLRPTISEELEAKGITNSRLAEVADDGLNANKVVFNKLGEKYTVEDHIIRHKFFESCSKLKGLFPGQTLTVDIQQKTGVLVVPGIIAEETWNKRLGDVKKMIEELTRTEAESDK